MPDSWTFQLFSSCVNMYFIDFRMHFYLISLKVACICSVKNYLFSFLLSCKYSNSEYYHH